MWRVYSLNMAVKIIHNFLILNNFLLAHPRICIINLITRYFKNASFKNYNIKKIFRLNNFIIIKIL